MHICLEDEIDRERRLEEVHSGGEGSRRVVRHARSRLLQLSMSVAKIQSQNSQILNGKQPQYRLSSPMLRSYPESAKGVYGEPLKRRTDTLKQVSRNFCSSQAGPGL